MTAYLLVEQNRPHADLFVRNAEGLWVLNPVGEGESLTIAPLGVVLPMEAIYEGITFNAQATPAVPLSL